MNDKIQSMEYPCNNYSQIWVITHEDGIITYEWRGESQLAVISPEVMDEWNLPTSPGATFQLGTKKFRVLWFLEIEDFYVVHRTGIEWSNT